MIALFPLVLGEAEANDRKTEKLVAATLADSEARSRVLQSILASPAADDPRYAVLFPSDGGPIELDRGTVYLTAPQLVPLGQTLVGVVGRKGDDPCTGAELWVTVDLTGRTCGGAPCPGPSFELRTKGLFYTPNDTTSPLYTQLVEHWTAKFHGPDSPDEVVEPADFCSLWKTKLTTLWGAGSTAACWAIAACPSAYPPPP